MSKYVKVDDVMAFINTSNRGNCDYFIVDKIEELCKSNKAYDVDAVVKELEEESDFFGGEPMGSLQKAYYCKGIDKAIDIVKAGGVK